MLALFLPAALAAEIQIHASSPVLITVDGRTVDFPKGQMVGTAMDLAGGDHEVRVTSIGGDLLDARTYGLKVDEQLRLKFANGALREIGRGQLPNMAGGEVVDLQMAVPGVSVDITINESGFDPVEGRPPPVDELAPPPPLEPVAMNPQEFGRLEQAVKDESFSSDQLDLIETAAAHHWLNMAQVVALLEHLSFSSDKLAALEILRHRIVDPQNAHLLNDAFSFSSDKEKAQELFR